jgi:hypothetical protein
MKIAKIRFAWVAVFACLVVAGAATVAVAANNKHKMGGDRFAPIEKCPTLMGGEIPTPLGLPNQKVELADGEVYTLVGKIQVSGKFAFFEVDLGEQPWLASRNRSASPYYLLDGGASVWNEYDKSSVRLSALAKGNVLQSSSNGGNGKKFEYIISLKVLSEREWDPDARCIWRLSH